MTLFGCVWLCGGTEIDIGALIKVTTTEHFHVFWTPTTNNQQLQIQLVRRDSTRTCIQYLSVRSGRSPGTLITPLLLPLN